MILESNTKTDFEVMKLVIKAKKKKVDFCSAFINEVNNQACEFLNIEKIDLNTRSRSEPNATYKTIILSLAFQHLYCNGFANLSQLQDIVNSDRCNFYHAVKRINDMSVCKHELSKKTYDCYTYINNQLI
jgi:hypothetical protein